MDTTLEEVFLKVSEEDQSLENSDVGTDGRGGHTVLLGLERGCVPLRGLGGSSPLAHCRRSLLSQGEEWSPAEPSLAKGSWPLLHSGLAEQIRPCSMPCHGEGCHGQRQLPFFFQT